MLIVYDKSFLALNLDRVAGMYVDKNKLIFRHDGDYVSKVCYDTDIDAKVAFKEIISAVAAGVKIFKTDKVKAHHDK